MLTEILKRDGRFVPFAPEKIEDAVFRCLRNGIEMSPERSREIAWQIRDVVEARLDAADEPVSVEQVQDLVEESLMHEGHYLAFRRYVLYREQHRRDRLEHPVDDAERERIARNRLYMKTPTQEYQFYSKYARWLNEAGRRETWEEAIDRVISFLWKKIGAALTGREWEELRQGMLRMEAMPSMRLLQMAGPAAERCNVCIYNCAYLPLSDLFSFSELLYILMQGTGVGFSVEPDYIGRLPMVTPQRGLEPDVYVVPDHTEGWCDALYAGMQHWFGGYDITFDTSGVRREGMRLHTKGGRASGPRPLEELLTFTRGKILARQGDYLQPIDAHDIACKEGWIVQVGGVRRAALISLSALQDRQMAHAKDGQFWTLQPQRQMANNSVVYDTEPSAVEFMEEWLTLAKSGSGERGIFNRSMLHLQIPERREFRRFGCNPCGEILLREHSFCNLSITVARKDDSIAELRRKVRLASILGTLQSTFTDFNYIRPQWRINCHEERLLGVDITGQMDCNLLRPNMYRSDLLDDLAQIAIKTNQEFARRIGINPSAATTAVKPSGNSAWLLDCASGTGPRYAPYFIRRMRGGAYDPISKLLRDEGVPCFPENGSTWETASVWVFEFPVKAPEGAMTRHDLTALEQLENWLEWKTHYTEHNPSTTIYINPEEWLAAGNWVYEHWKQVGGLAFLPKGDDDHVYELAPYSEISEEEYDRRLAEFPEIDWSKLRRYELEDSTEGSREFACTSGACSL